MADRFSTNLPKLAQDRIVAEAVRRVKRDIHYANDASLVVHAAVSASTAPWSGITGTPTTLAGYGITDAYTTTEVDDLLDDYLPLAGGTLTGNLLFSADNTYDIGAAGATRPRTGYFGTSVVVGTDPGGSSVIRATGAMFASTMIAAGGDTGFNSSTANLQTQSTGDAIQLTRFAASTGGIGLKGIKSRGATIGSLASVLAGDTILNLSMAAIAGNNTTVATAGQLQLIVATGGVAATTVGASWVFRTTNIAGTTADRWKLDSEGPLLAGTDNVYDIGAAGATRPRSVYVGTEVIIGADPGWTDALQITGSIRSSGQIHTSISGSAVLLVPGASNNPYMQLYNGTYTGSVEIASNALGLYYNGAYRLTFSTSGHATFTNNVIVGTDPGGSDNVRVGGSIRTTGNVGVGNSVDTSVGVYVRSAALTGTSQYALYLLPTFSSAATVSGHAARASVKTAVAAFTMTQGIAYYADAPSLGAGSAITTQYGFYGANQGVTGVTHAYGLYLAATSGAATTNISLYNAGTSALIGTVGIGATALTYAGLYLANTALTTTDQYGISVAVTASSSATVYTAVNAGIRTAAAAFTLTSAYAMRVSAVSLGGGGSAITTAYGLRVGNQGAAGVTNAYGLYLDATSGAATTNISFYNAGKSQFVDVIGLGTAPAAQIGLYLRYTVSGSATQYGMISQPIFWSDATAGYGILTNVQTTAAAFTMTSGFGLRINNAIVGAGSAITNLYGLYIDNQTSGAGSNYAIYSAGGAVYFAGSTVISSDPGGSGALRVGGTGIFTQLFVNSTAVVYSSGEQLLVKATTTTQTPATFISIDSARAALRLANNQANGTVADLQHFVDNAGTARAGFRWDGADVVLRMYGNFGVDLYYSTTQTLAIASGGVVKVKDVIDTLTATDMLLKRNNVLQLTLGSLAATFAGTVATAAPATGAAGAWKLGQYKTDGVGLAVSTTNYIQVEVDGGGLKKLAIVA